MKMNILIICCKFQWIDRPTINDHLFSFRRYGGENNQFFYFYIDSSNYFPSAILNFPFDAVIFHYTFLAQRFGGAYFQKRYEYMLPNLKRLHGIKVIIPQDEYVYTEFLWKLCKDLNVSYIFTTYQKKDYATVFPEDKVGENVSIYTVFPGYIEDKVLKKLSKKLEIHKERPIDIGYRAQSDCFIFGQHGQLKSDLARIFQQEISSHPEINADIKLITMDGEHVLKGKKWFDFLLASRTMLGCLGGSSLFDPTGCFRERVLEYVESNPEASYKQVETECFPGEDWKVTNCSLGPKNFEYAMAQTCQILVEGWYHDVFFPGKHYIEIKKDFSNLDDVIIQIKDKELCQRIAQQCYTDVVLSGKFSYRVFVQMVLSKIQEGISNIGCQAPSVKQIHAVERMCLVQKIRFSFFLFLRLCKGELSFYLKRIAPSLHSKLKKIYKVIVN